MKSPLLQRFSSLFSNLNCLILLAVSLFIATPSALVNAIEWVQVNVEGFDTDWERAQHNYGVFDDSLTVYKNRLYAGTDNPINGPEIWVYAGNGSTIWTKLSDNKANPGKSIFYGCEATEFLTVYAGYLYAGSVYGVNAPLKGNGQLWRTNYPEDVNSWTKVFDYDDWLANPTGGDTGDLLSAIEFNGYLYLSASAVESGNRNAQMFRSTGGINWEKVLDGDSLSGFNDNNAISAYSFEIFNSELYVGVTNNNDGAEIWKTSDGSEWTQVNSDDMAADAYQRDRDVIRQLKLYNSYLYAFLKNYAGTAWVEVWRSQNGTDWNQVGGNGLGDPGNNKDGRGVEVYNGCLYVGTGGTGSQSARIYQTCDGITFSKIINSPLGDPNNHGVMALKKFDSYLYAATFRFITGGIGGAEVWRYSNDTDGDGIPDDRDICPESNLEPFISIGDCNTGVKNQLFNDGCTMSDLIAKCSAEAMFRIGFIKCIYHITNDWEKNGLINRTEKYEIRHCALITK